MGEEEKAALRLPVVAMLMKVADLYVNDGKKYQKRETNIFLCNVGSF